MAFLCTLKASLSLGEINAALRRLPRARAVESIPTQNYGGAPQNSAFSFFFWAAARDVASRVLCRGGSAAITGARSVLYGKPSTVYYFNTTDTSIRERDRILLNER